ncbi:MAG: GNAT family N-acetyltransferase [Capsulimonadaceae bacterium]|nr:GNAT family N-acetyltransferase [Capsulimonadaceae bacterium]
MGTSEMEERAQRAGRGRSEVDIVSIRLASINDSALLWTWEHDIAVRENSFAESPRDKEEFVSWFAERVHDAASPILIGLAHDSIPIGRAYLELAKEPGVIHVAVAPDQRGKGYSPVLIQAATEYAFANSTIASLAGYMRVMSVAPIRAFEAAGYEQAGATIIDDEDALVYAIRREDFVRRPLT